MGIELGFNDLLEAHEKSAKQLQAIWRRNGDVSTIDQIRLIVQMLRRPLSIFPLGPTCQLEMLQNAYTRPLFDYPPILNEDAIATLEGMRAPCTEDRADQQYRSQPWRGSAQTPRKAWNTQFFDVTVFSDEVGCRKPDKRIFDLAVKGLGTEPSNTVHVGDNPEADIWGAKQAGMRAVLFDFPVPEEFKRQPGSLFALSRADRQVPDSEIKPDARITSLTDVLGFVDSLS